MSNPFLEIVAETENLYRSAVLTDTWGHLAPKLQTKYKGSILFGVSAFGGNNAELIDFDFDGLDSSPWLFEDVETFLHKLDTSEMGGKIFKFEGTYKRFKNDNHHFWGRVREIIIK
jgi:hypothetical protein